MHVKSRLMPEHPLDIGENRALLYHVRDMNFCLRTDIGPASLCAHPRYWFYSPQHCRNTIDSSYFSPYITITTSTQGIGSLASLACEDDVSNDLLMMT